uniref:Uncharacterized protein n=1 Tax=Tanacetum cinerariifolium TaxID=118510 RepID=A0A6L2KIF6_TANCI|nr:hypothetical protein [Tanacetum cinerariifolium]
MKDVLNGNSIRRVNAFKMRPYIFKKLCRELQSNYGLKSSDKMFTLEKLGVFVYTFTLGVSNRDVGEHFQCFRDTINLAFHDILEAITAKGNSFHGLASAIIRPKDLRFPIPPQIMNDKRYMLYFKVAMLSMRVKQLYKKTGRKLEFNGKEPVGFDKNKVECFNYHRRGHFATDCISARNSGNMSRDVGNAGYIGIDNGKRPAKEEGEQALVVQDGLAPEAQILSQFIEKEVLDIKEEEVTETVFDNRSSDEENSIANDRFKKGEGYHVVPPPLTGNYMPPKPDLDEENSIANDRFKKGEGYHVVPPPLTGNYMPPKPDLSFAGLDDSIYKFKISETVTSLAKDEKDAPKTSTVCVEKPKEDRIPVCVTKPKAAISTSAAKPINTAGLKQSVNFSRTRSTFHKSHSRIRWSFYNATAHSRRNSTERVNTDGAKAVSTIKGNEVTAIKTSAGCVWRPRVNAIDQLSKDNRWICTCVDYVDPQGRLKHITENKAYLADYQKIHDGGFVAFSSSRGKVTGKGNQIYKKVKVIRSDNGTKFKNRDLVEFYGMKGIKREYSNARTPQQNGAEAVNTACYVLNRALVTKTHNKTPYELLNCRSPRIDFIRPFGCHVTILNTLDPLGKFKGKADEGFLVGYFVTSKAFRVFNTKIRKVEENLHVSLQDTNGNAGTQDNVDVGKKVSDQYYIVLPLWSSISSTYKSSDDKPTDGKPKDDTGSKIVKELVNKEDQAYIDELDRLMSLEKKASDTTDALRKEFEQGCMDQRGVTQAGNTNSFNTVSNPVNDASTSGTFSAGGPSSSHSDAFIPTNTLLHADFNNMKSSTIVSPIPIHKVHIDHPKDQIMGDPKFKVQTRRVEKKSSGAHALMEPKKVSQALDDESRVEAMNKKDKRGIVVRNKARLVAQGHRQEEGINYDEVFAPVSRIETIRIFLAFASFMGFIVYQMDVYKVEKALYGLHKLPKPALMNKRFQMSSMGELTFFLELQVKQSKEGIFISEDKYVAEILKKFDFSSIKTASTPIETQKPLVKYEVVADVDVYLYRSMIGSLMYLTASRPDIMFAVYVCSRFQVTPKLSHLQTVKRIFRYLKGQAKLGLWYLRDSPFDLEAYSDSDYAGANLDRKSTTGETFSPINLYMADLKFVDQHNMVACLEKTEENAEFHQIVDFLSTCSINYALTVSPTIYASYIEQFWNTAISKTVNSVKQIHVIVDGKAVVISESSVTSDLLFTDEDSISCLTNAKKFENLALMGYEQISTKLTFQKGSFLPQEKFLIHTILHYISSKLTAWNAFSINLALAFICLANGQTFNFSKFIFDGMLRNLDSKKFLMYLRFLKLFLNKQLKDLPEPFNDTYETPKHSKNVFSDMERRSNRHMHQETTLWGADAQTRFETASKRSSDLPLSTGHTVRSREDRMEQETDLTDFVPPTSHDSPLSGGHTPRSDEGRPNLLELMNIFTKLSNGVLALEEAKTTQDKGRNNDQTAELNLTNKADIEVIVKNKGSCEKGGSTTDQVSTARPETLIKMRSEKAKEKRTAFEDVEKPPRLTRSTTTLQPLPTIDPKDKGKGVLVEEEPKKLQKVKRRDQWLAQIESDAYLAQSIYEEELAELDRAQKE